MDLLKNLKDTAIFILIQLFFIIPISVYSIKYHAVKNRILETDMDQFLRNLWQPARFIYSRNLKDIYYKDKEHTPEQIQASLMMQRIIASFIPVMGIVVSIYALARSILNNDEWLLRSLLVFLLIPTLLVIAWRFGKHIGQK